MEYFKALEVRLSERGYNISEDFAYPTNYEYLQGVKLPFEVIDGYLTETKHQVLREMEKNLKIRMCWNPQLQVIGGQS